jgi:transcriptional regulator with AAA-type ATPase domain/transposase
MESPSRTPARASNRITGSPIIGESASIQAIRAYIDKVAMADCHVLITGETGTGKELVAAQIHRHSRRSQQPFICLNCPAIPDSLFESELFGYERGAFTGAVTRNLGAFERADGGTLFLDEIGDLNPYAQAKLLRAVEDKVVHRLGGQRDIPLDIRIIAATNQNLEQMATTGQFRKDLYFRLNVANIHLPPLRERKADLWPLCAYYIEALNQQWDREVTGFTDDVFDALLRHDWPGNVRELKNLLEAIFITVTSRAITFTDLPEAFSRRLWDAEVPPLSERDRLLAALVATQWNKSQAAQKLHWSRMTLYRKLRQYHLTAPSKPQVQRISKPDQGQASRQGLPNVPVLPGRAMQAQSPTPPSAWEFPETLWQRMATLIPPRKSLVGHPQTVDLRRITEGIFYVLRTRTPWHECPREHFGPSSTIYYYFTQWLNTGVFEQLWAEASTIFDDLHGQEWTWQCRSRTHTENGRPAPLAVWVCEEERRRATVMRPL